MTDSLVKTRPGKRSRLITSAKELLHRQGLHKPSLAEIAVAANVPPGNVYYYFKTRDDLVRAVVDDWIDQQRTVFAALEGSADPAYSLKAYMHGWAAERETMARYGCPLAALTSELGKIGGDLADHATRLFELRLDWMREQFDHTGRADARRLAVTLLAGMEGSAALAQALRDPEIITDEIARLSEWIDSVL